MEFQSPGAWIEKEPGLYFGKCGNKFQQKQEGSDEATAAYA